LTFLSVFARILRLEQKALCVVYHNPLSQRSRSHRFPKQSEAFLKTKRKKHLITFLEDPFMAKTSKIARNEQRKELVDRYAERRRELKKIIKNPKTSPEDRDAAYAKLRSFPRDSNANRVVNRCSMTGRPRAYFRKFGISRIALRDMALRGDLPGVRKASW
jgi:small subunit ribosomal protein S14